MFVASATDGRVWLAGTDCDRRRMVGVREVTVDGDVTVESDHRMVLERDDIGGAEVGRQLRLGQEAQVEVDPIGQTGGGQRRALGRDRHVRSAGDD